MNSNNLLRKQVVSETKKKRLITYILITLSFIYLIISFLFGDTGFIRYMELTKRKTQFENQISALKNENIAIKNQLLSLKENPFYMEKYAREEFGLARPDEYIFQYDR